MIFHIFCAAFRKVTFILIEKNCAFVGQAQRDACDQIDLIDKHIARCEQTERLVGRSEQDRYSRLRSINKTANVLMHAKVRWRYLERCGSVPYTVGLNWIPLSCISAPMSFKTTHGALPPGSNFHPWSLCCRQERAECKKRSEPKERRKIRRWWRMSFPRYEWTINLARASSLQFSALRQDISVKKGGKKNGHGRKTAPVTRERKERRAKLRGNRSTDHSRSSASVIFRIKK